MQRKKNIQLLISLVVLVVIATLLMVFDLRKDSSVDKNMFKQSDLSQVNRVMIRNRDEQVEVNFDGTRWKVNDQLADRGMVEVLFATLQQAEPKRKAASSIIDSLSQHMELNGIRVSLYADDQLLETFIVMGTESKSQTYFMKEGGEPFVVTIPGYRVYVGGIFEIGLLGWKDKLAFNLNWRNFRGLKVEFSNQPDENFEVGLGRGKFFTILNEQAVDTTRLNDFLDAVSYLTVDEYVASGQSIESQLPYMTITAEDVSGRKYSLEIFEPETPNGPFKVIVGEKQAAQISRRKLSELMKPKSWFIGGR